MRAMSANGQQRNNKMHHKMNVIIALRLLHHIHTSTEGWMFPLE